jgi:hypothetical protein
MVTLCFVCPLTSRVVFSKSIHSSGLPTLNMDTESLFSVKVSLP